MMMLIRNFDCHVSTVTRFDMIPMGLQARDEAKTVGDGETKSRKAEKQIGRAHV